MLVYSKIQLINTTLLFTLDIQVELRKQGDYSIEIYSDVYKIKNPSREGFFI